MIKFIQIPDNLISVHTGSAPEGLGYKAQPFNIEFNNRVFQFLRPHDSNDVLDTLPEELYAKDKFLPYWAEQWPSSEVMLAFLAQQSIPESYRIIELGCGLGIVSTLIGSKCSAVVATDISYDAALFTKINIELNKGRPMPCCVDWRALPFKSRFDSLIASDVLYEARWIDPVLECCKTLLKPQGRAWIADPCRTFWGTFKKRSVEFGFTCEVIHKAKVNAGKHTIEIVELRNAETSTF